VIKESHGIALSPGFGFAPRFAIREWDPFSPTKIVELEIEGSWVQVAFFLGQLSKPGVQKRLCFQVSSQRGAPVVRVAVALWGASKPISRTTEDFGTLHLSFCRQSLMTMNPKTDIAISLSKMFWTQP
jgi:hypothetical protein